MNIVLIGMNHRTTPLEIRERLYFACEDTAKPLKKIMVDPHIKEALYLSTCNRVEVLAVCDDLEEAVRSMKDFIFSQGNLTREEMDGCFYVYCGRDAIRHLFRVASSIDSMVMGEPQILGQVKGAYRECVENGASGVILNKLLHQAFRAAKRVRTETAIANNAVSISFAAVELAKKILGDLRGKKILLIGAGEMAELAARHLMNSGVDRIVVANRTYSRALRLAEDFHGVPAGFDRIPEKLQEVDIVVASTGAAGYIIDGEMIHHALKGRKNRLMFLIDIAVPRDVDPRVGDIDNVYLYNIDDLQEVVDENLRGRLMEAEKAEEIIDEEVVRFTEWYDTLEVVPTIVSLKEKADGIVKGELDKAGSWIKNLGEEERKNVEVLASSIVNKILHDPVTRLKEESRNDGAVPYIAVIRRLFKLERE
jgi:glutamyl-tRNA reductase